MSNQSSRFRHRLVAASAITVAIAAVGFAFVSANEAVAGQGRDPIPASPEDLALTAPKLDVRDIPTAEDLWVGEANRLSIPFTPEQMGVDGGGPAPVPTAEPAYVYVNMDGANLVCNGGDSSTANSSIIACQYGFSGPYPSYGGTAAQRQTVIDAVKADWAPFNVVITPTRPDQGPYTMCMTGPANQPFGNGVLGIAPLDCNNSVPNNIVFAFHSASQLGGGLGANTQATTISQEVAHAYGLEHVNSSADIMNPYSQGGNPSFTDTCITIDPGQNGILCGSQHSQYCSQTSQNSYQELLGMFGANDPDNQPPNVVVSYPSNGDVFAPGSNFVIECQANDNQNVATVELWIDSDKMGATKFAAPYEWEVNGIPVGNYEIYCVAADDWDNTAMSPVVSISVEEGGMPGDTGADPTTGGDTGDPTTTGGDSGGDSGGDTGGDLSDSGGLPPGFGLDETDTGCACSSDGPSPTRPAWMLLMLLGLPLLRRRDVSA